MEKSFDICERSFNLSKQIVLFIDTLEYKWIYNPIIDQLLRSSTSIGANIIEGKSGNSRRNLIYFFSIALRSANETKYWLRLIGDTLEADNDNLLDVQKEVDEIAKILAKSIITMRKNDTYQKQ